MAARAGQCGPYIRVRRTRRPARTIAYALQIVIIVWNFQVVILLTGRQRWNAFYPNISKEDANFSLNDGRRLPKTLTPIDVGNTSKITSALPIFNRLFPQFSLRYPHPRNTCTRISRRYFVRPAQSCRSVVLPQQLYYNI